MIQWRRAPSPASGSKWKTSGCIQYSVSVQKRYPPTIVAATSSPDASRTPSTSNTAIAGRKTTSGTLGCTRERRSSRSDSNILGEALRTSVRRVSTDSNLAQSTGSVSAVSRYRERHPTGRLPVPEPSPKAGQARRHERTGQAIEHQAAYRVGAVEVNA